MVPTVGSGLDLSLTDQGFANFRVTIYVKSIISNYFVIQYKRIL